MDARQIVIRFPNMAKYFSLFQSVQTGSGAHPSLYVMVTGRCTQGVKRPDHETEHSLSSRVEVNPLKTKINLNYI
jgi:hypothetical protein